ncbi:MAG: class I SAM-dependent methyltransferase [Thermoplasmatota archaeon]
MKGREHVNSSDDIKRSVSRTYDNIAPHFAPTRENVWPPTMELIRYRSPCIIGDLGCGTGRALVEAASRGCSVIGIDSSGGQLEMARSALIKTGLIGSARLYVADMEDVPLNDRELDICLMIASLHHLPDADSRRSALNEAYRITKPGGILQVSVWTWDQERFRRRHLDRLHGRRSTDDDDGQATGDFLVPWKKGTNAMRFYHLYGPGELEREIRSSRWTLQRSFFDGRNHWAECIRGP